MTLADYQPSGTSNHPTCSLCQLISKMNPADRATIQTWLPRDSGWTDPDIHKALVAEYEITWSQSPIGKHRREQHDVTS